MIWVELVFKICNQDSQKFPNLPVYLFSAWTARQTNNCVLLWGICWSICRNFPSNTLYLLIFWLMRMAPRASNYGTQLCFNVLKAPVLLIFTAMMFIPSVYFRKRETSRYAAVAICVQSTIKCLHLVYSLFLRVSNPFSVDCTQNSNPIYPGSLSTLSVPWEELTLLLGGIQSEGELEAKLKMWKGKERINQNIQDPAKWGKV